MEKLKLNKPTRLVASLVGGIAFMAVFALNVMLFVKTDGKSVTLSFSEALAEGECGWICPAYGCTEPVIPYGGMCSLHYPTLRIAIECPQDEEEEEEEVATAYEREVSTAVSQYGQTCTATNGRTGTRWKFCNDITCEGTGNVSCVPHMESGSACYWGECINAYP